MKPDPESRRLLDDLLADDATLRERLLADTLQEVRGRRRRRQSARGVVALFVIGGLAVWGPWRKTQPDPLAHRRTAEALETVRSVPLAADRLVVSRAGSVNVVQTGAGPLTVRTTTTPVPLVDDAELFQLLAGRPAMIVRPLDGPARLILPGEGEDLLAPAN